MIDPNDVTNFDRSDAELQEFFLFACVVAGKTATTQARLLDNFIKSLPFSDHHALTPFDRIAMADLPGNNLLGLIRESRLGQYNRLYNIFSKAPSIDLRSCSVDYLQTIDGIGPKTARFFLLHSRRDQRYAALDTHILKYLRDLGYDAPKATPSSAKRYAALEALFLEQADKCGMTVADLDLYIWKHYSNNA